jgi:hypothetical protein
MTMSIETKRREILQMLANGSITAEEAGDLLVQLKAEETEAAAPPPPPAPKAEEPAAAEGEPLARRPGKKGRWLNIRVTDAESGRDRVSVRIPLSLARIGLRMGARFAPEIEGLDWDEALQELSSGGEQTLIEVNDESDGEHVHIFVS